MIKSGKDLLIILLAVVCVGVSLVLLPWAELGFNGKFPAWLSWLPSWVVEFFNELGKGTIASQIQEYLTNQGAQTNLGDYAYALFLFLALIAAAVAIILIGREESEEKLLLPVKK